MGETLSTHENLFTDSYKFSETYYKENLNLNYPSAQYLLILNFNIKYFYILIFKKYWKEWSER